MTKINFDFGKPSAGGIVDLSNATVRVIPTERFRNDSRIVVREGFEVALDAKGKATVTVPPTDNTFCYEVTIGLDTDLWKFRRYVNVPDSATAVEFADLVDVDSGTLAPALNTGAALTYLLASSLQEAQAMSAANPGQMVFYPEGQAKTVASQILEDLTGARAVVESQSAAAAQAANAAQASAAGAQAASVQAADAVQSVSEQTAQVSANAAAVQSVADSISESKAVVESHANEALTAIDEAVKSVKDKASDATVEDKAETTAESTPDTTDAADDGSQEA
ncbi:hypothetical protein ABJB08_01015 [Bifidobacterium catenulatum]|uniref:hypothetical protein n=1 Tax=Bifidobacterium catenulatum TaxID=1686 RepID=UPI00326718D8